MKTMILRMLTAVSVLSSGLPAMAWSAGGHMVVAAEAYHELPDVMKVKVGEILKAHPNYARWEKAFKQDTNHIDLGIYIFMRASIWPDEIRRTEGDNSQYDHPHWHYIDYPLKPPGFPMEPDAAPEDNVVFGIGECEKTLLDNNAPAALRAAQLSYLIHLVGDVHQPLHCAMLVNDTYPTGDRGGNDFYVKPAEKGIRLHSFWDGLLGRSYNFSDQLHYAIQLQAEHSRKSLRELNRAKTPKEWSLEGRALAMEAAYRKGKLKGSKDERTAPPLPNGYAKAAKRVAERRGVLAGYRLADELQKCLK